MFTKLATNFLIKFIKTLYEPINVCCGLCRYNFRYHLNAVRDAITNQNEKIALVLYVDDKEQCLIIHFINFHNNQFIDNTLGVWSKTKKYYLVRFIRSKDFFQIESIFNSYRKELNSFLPFYLRYFVAKDNF